MSDRWRPGELMVAALAVLVATTIAFRWFPGLDLATSALFHTPGAGFEARTNSLLVGLRWVGQAATLGLCLTALVAVLWPMLTTASRFFLGARDGLFVLGVHLLGPGLVVNLFMKETFGRARPVRVDVFGGEAPFSRVWDVSDACRTNCSLASGEASSAAALLALAVITPPDLRRPVAAALAAFAVTASTNRIAFGGHFLSDVLVAWSVTALAGGAVFWLVYRSGLVPGEEPLRARLRAAARGAPPLRPGAPVAQPAAAVGAGETVP